MSLWTNSPPKINIAPEEWWLEDNGRVLSYWEGNFSGAMLTNAQKSLLCSQSNRHVQ